MAGDHLLVLNSPDSGCRDLLRETLPQARFHFHHFDFASHSKQNDGRDTWTFGPWLSEGSFDQGLIFLNRGRALMEMTTTMAALRVRKGGSLLILGAKKEGSDSIGIWLEESLGSISHKDKARHGIIYQLNLDRPVSDRKLGDWAIPYEFLFLGGSWKACSLPGVFSAGRLDAGTALLLKGLRAEMDPATVLDLGCGSGVLGLAARVLWPQARVDLADSSALALEASRKTFEANSLAPASLRASDLYSTVSEHYDLILCNPPFHEGTYRDYTFVDRLLRDSASHLNPGGRLFLVANRTLPYVKRIGAIYPNSTVLAENPGFRVYSVFPPPPGEG